MNSCFDNRCSFSSLAPGQLQGPVSAEENKDVPASNSDAGSESVERVLQVSKLISFGKLVTYYFHN